MLDKPTDAMIRVAQALHDYEESWNDHTWEQLPSGMQRAFLGQAAAAMKALDATLTPDSVQSDGEERLASRLAVDAFVERWDGQMPADTDYVAQLMKNAVKARLTSLSAPVEKD